MPEIISTPQSLVQTQNGKRFYVFSGITTVDNTETAMIDIDNIGERDIKIALEVGNDVGNDLYYEIRVKVNGITIHQNRRWARERYGGGFDEIRTIIPANCSFVVTIQQESGSDDYTLMGHGRYLSL